MKQAKYFSGLSRVPGGTFRRNAAQSHLTAGSPLFSITVVQGEAGPSSMERLFPLKPKQPV
jgi:hypothetical protein